VKSRGIVGAAGLASSSSTVTERESPGDDAGDLRLAAVTLAQLRVGTFCIAQVLSPMEHVSAYRRPPPERPPPPAPRGTPPPDAPRGAAYPPRIAVKPAAAPPSIARGAAE
jgi:hypothetical protein